MKLNTEQAEAIWTQINMHCGMNNSDAYRCRKQCWTLLARNLEILLEQREPFLINLVTSMVAKRISQ